MSSLAYVIEAVKGTNVSAGAQTMHWLNEGPYTGQTSPTMLASIGCTHVLLGHSERRIYAHETDDMVNWKLKAALAHDLVPMVCVGETQDKRESGLTEAVLRWQIACSSQQHQARAGRPHPHRLRARLGHRHRQRRPSRTDRRRPSHHPSRRRRTPRPARRRPHPHPLRRQRQARQHRHPHGRARDRRRPRRRRQPRPAVLRRHPAERLGSSPRSPSVKQRSGIREKHASRP